MKADKQFEDQLYKLFDDRTHWLRSAVRGTRPGKPPSFNRKKLQGCIEKLNGLATESLVDKVAQPEFDKIKGEKRQWHVKRGKGWGIKEKKKTFNAWFDSKISFHNYIYILWAGRRCKYVGSSRKDRRIANHFEKYWFWQVTRIDVYPTSRSSDVPKLECLAVHAFDPSDNLNWPATRKWTKKCPICLVHEYITKELQKIFRLK